MDIEQPSLYNCYFVESCQTSPSKRENRNFGIVIRLFVSYLFGYGWLQHIFLSQNFSKMTYQYDKRYKNSLPYCRRVHYSYLLFCNFQAMPVSMPFHPLDFVRYSSTVHYWISQVCHYLFAVVYCVRIWAISKLRYFIYIQKW